MKVAVCLALVASVSAFAPQTNNARTSLAMQAESSRREALAGLGAAAAAFLPAAANAAAGESPRFSIFGLIGDGTSYSEGAAYGTDQSKATYSPYSVYSDVGPDTLYKPEDKTYLERKKAILAETRKRLGKLPGYIEKKKWSEVNNELTRFMYETRGAVKALASTGEQKSAAKDFFKAIEDCSINSRLKKGDACLQAANDSVAKLDKFVSLI